MTVHVALQMLIVIIVGIGLIGWIANVQLANRYRRWLQELERAETQVGANPTSFGTPQSPLIGAIMDEYRAHRSEGIEWINTPALIDKNVTASSMPFVGLLRLPVGVVERIVAQIPSWPMIVGILGTFMGLTMALYSMQQTLLQLSQVSTELPNATQIIQAISEPFMGMSLAFVSSIVGIGVALFLRFMHSGMFALIGPNAAQAKEQFINRCENFLDHHLQLAVQREKPKDTMEKILDRFVDKVKESFDASVHQFGKHVLRLTSELDESVQKLGQILNQNDALTTKLQEGSERFGQFAQELQRYTQKLQKRDEQVAIQVQKLEGTLKALGQEWKRGVQLNQESSQALERVLDRSDERMQHMMQHSEQQMERFNQRSTELERSVGDVLDRERQQMTNQHQEWYNRYQENMDSYARSAESFSQAVQHLHRQWEGSLERLKRDLATSFTQTMDKYLGRQQYGQSDMEIRELVGQLNTIQHLLDRELQQMERTAQESNHILRAIYEWGRSQVGHMAQERTIVQRPVAGNEGMR